MDKGKKLALVLAVLVLVVLAVIFEQLSGVISSKSKGLQIID